MIVKDILKDVALYLNLNNISNFLNNNTPLDSEGEIELNNLIKCVNLINVFIATDYVPILCTSNLLNVSEYGMQLMTNINNKKIFDIKKVVDIFNNIVSYEVHDGKLKTNCNKVYITYMVLPNPVTIDSSILDYEYKINSRVFALGVCGEYLFINGDVEGSSMFDTRFKQSLINAVRKKGPIKLTTRNWY